MRPKTGVDRFYWQYKNGKLVELRALKEVFAAINVGCYEAWDRSLGAWVFYA
jgi:hypothetical protein